jgi:tryptophan 2,3-dioxygenase
MTTVLSGHDHSRVRQALTDLDLSDYVETQRDTGRFDLDAEFVRRWADQYRTAASLLKHADLSPELAEAMLLLREITYPAAMQERSRVPSYYPYTCVNVLDWYLGDCGEDLEAQKRKCVPGIVALLLEIGRFEMHSLIGCEPFQPLHFEPEFAIERIRMLKDVYTATVRLSEQIPGTSVRPLPPRTYENIIDYANEPGRLSALIQFTCMPQTRYHDEVLFLRSIHVSEFCFYGIRIAVAQARDAITRGALNSARVCLEQAIAFSDVLHQIFRVVRNMPPLHFLDFRESAANASAVQSANYQLMDAHLFGLSEHKRMLFQRIPHLDDMLRPYGSGFLCLRDVLKSIALDDNEAAPLLETARELDSKLLTWRGLHVGFANLYLADIPVGTGGTSGAAYLKLFLRNTLFGETTIDLAADGHFSEPSAVPSTTRIDHPDMHLAPPRDLIAPDKLPVNEPGE